MRKLFDKYVAQSSKGQMITLGLAFVLLIIVGGIVGKTVASADKGDNIYDFGRPETWGFMQCVDGGFVQATIRNNTVKTDDKVEQPAPMSVILLSLAFWVGGMILVSFFTGAATDFLSSRREQILKGDVDYEFKKKYILIIGFDFQVKNLVKKLLTESRNPLKRADRRDVVVITDSPVEDLYEDLLPELEAADARRLYMMRKDIALDESYEKFRITGAEEIYLIGDGDSVGRDGKTLQALEAMTRKAEKEIKTPGYKGLEKQIKVYMHIEDSILYSQVRAMKLPADDALVATSVTVFDLEVYNYYESWAWECWSHKDATDGKDAYLPLRHIRGSKHVELFVIGAGRMGRAMINFAMPLMNYGEDGKHCKITVFDPEVLKKSFLPDRETLDALPEIEVKFEEMDGCSDEANAIMFAAAQKPDTSVTVVIALSDPGLALRAYAEFSNRLRRENVSVLVWQASHSNDRPNKKYLMMGGEDSTADQTKIRYFGMTDKLPWKDPTRFNYGMAVNYYYNCWFPYGKEYPASPKATAKDFVATAKDMWKVDENGIVKSSSGGVLASEEWVKTQRWKKWSSVNSGDTFREKSVIFDGVPYVEAAEKCLKAEHNRWWTEKLLGGWVLDPTDTKHDGSHADKAKMIHGDMVPFEDLTEGVKDKDKINIAAMAACGFIN